MMNDIVGRVIQEARASGRYPLFSPVRTDGTFMVALDGGRVVELTAAQREQVILALRPLKASTPAPDPMSMTASERQAYNRARHAASRHD